MIDLLGGFAAWRELGVELLGHKYRYYVLDDPALADTEFDMLEKEWAEMGRHNCRTRTPPFWVGFDGEHPWADEAKNRVLREQ